MTYILQLPGWEATGTRTEQGEFVIEAKYNVPATACIKCGSNSIQIASRKDE
jgi:hypothetical protein